MAGVLLTGAGFSFNWGGKLAREVNTAIAMRVQDDPDLAALLRRLPNFEEALAELQNAAARSERGAKERLKKLEDGIVEVFRDMNRHLATKDFSFSKDVSMPAFLARFDAIFTLNQDLLIEAQYENPMRANLSLSPTRRWSGVVLPGIENAASGTSGAFYDPLIIERRPVASPRTTAIDPRYQPYFKLHGSMNWQDRDGERLLVMGGNKGTTRANHPILMWYGDKFVEMLSRPGARLMVMGYSFADDHINRLIQEGWENGGKTLSMFIVQPHGIQSLREVNLTSRPGSIFVPGRLDEITVFESTRPFRSTFDGSDPGELEMLVDYASER
jgi:SIR2-like domain